MPTIEDSARGIMVGIAVGNLLGLPYEGWPQAMIGSLHPNGLHDIEARADSFDDDDLAQSIIIADAAAEGALSIDDLGRRFTEWMETNGAGIGILTQDVLRLHQGGMPIAEASWAAWKGTSAGNGALMRCAPIAIRWCDDVSALVRNSIISAVPTHWDARCGWSCVILNLALAATLRGAEVTAEELLDVGRQEMRGALAELEQYDYSDEPPAEVIEVAHQAYREGMEDLPLDGGNMGYTLLALRVALASLWRAPNFENGLRAVVEAGGDTDTNGAIVGAALGARFGLETIPERWRDSVRQLRPGREPMEHYAERLLLA